jgi:heptaprenyl diphosphate synthase
MFAEYIEIQNEMSKIEDYIKKNISSRNKLLSSIVNELVKSGGKRTRPAFLIISSQFGKYNRKKSVSAAGAIEILHTATLVHDDIIDRSKFRRGKATISEKYGSEMAIYAGDFLFTKAVLMLSNGISVEKLDMVARAVKVICEGEVDQYQERYDLNISTFSYLKRITRKTAVLFAAACGLGAYLSKCQASIIKQLSRFGMYYGIAFQIRDDLNDFLSNRDSMGKTVGIDFVNGNITLPIIYSKSPELSNILINFKNSDIEGEKENFDKVMKLVNDKGGIEKTKIMLEKYILKGVKILDNLPENKYRELFRKMIMELGSGI